jgi:hypothetical protein
LSASVDKKNIYYHGSLQIKLGGNVASSEWHNTESFFYEWRVQEEQCRTDKHKTKIPYLHMYKPHFSDKNLPSKTGMQLIHGILKT